jgi:uncharacterized protein
MTKFYIGDSGKLAKVPGLLPNSFDEYISDPARPVPYTQGIWRYRNNEYMIEDQRFAAKRPDVLVYKTEVLNQDLTVTGRLKADIFISSTGTDADLVVKIIDVIPDIDTDRNSNLEKSGLAEIERLVRAEVFRCKFRNSYEKPQPLLPGQPSEIAFSLNDIAHTFKKGHRIMVQIQSSWFPLVDRNPQQFVKIPFCNASDFQKASIRLYHDQGHPSSISLPILD